MPRVRKSAGKVSHWTFDIAGQIMTSRPMSRAVDVTKGQQRRLAPSAKIHSERRRRVAHAGRVMSWHLRIDTPSHDAVEFSLPASNTRSSCSSGMALPSPTPRIMAARTAGASKRSPHPNEANSSASLQQRQPSLGRIRSFKGFGEQMVYWYSRLTLTPLGLR